MPELASLLVALLTHRDEDSDTRGRVTLSINVDGEQLLNQGLPLLQIRAQASLYKFNVEGKRINSDTLTPSSVRLQISDRSTGSNGDDAWKPERFFLWGVEAPPPFKDLGIFPLAIEMGFREELSTDASEGVPSFPLRLVKRGNTDMRINRLLILLATETGTKNSLEIKSSAMTGWWHFAKSKIPLRETFELHRVFTRCR